MNNSTPSFILDEKMMGAFHKTFYIYVGVARQTRMEGNEEEEFYGRYGV